MFPDVDSAPDEPEFVAGEPVAAKEVKTGALAGLGAVVRIPLGVGLIVGLLFCSCMGVPTMMRALGDLLGIEISNDLISAMIPATTGGVFFGGVYYMMQRHAMRNWLAERRLGEVDVTVKGRPVAGEQMEVTVEIPRLVDSAATGVEVAREVVAIEGLAPGQKAALVSEERRSAEARKGASVQAVTRESRDMEVLWRDSETIELGDNEGGDSSVTVSFPVTGAISGSSAVSQLLLVDIDMPWWWFNWYSSVKVDVSKSEPAVGVDSGFR